MFRWIKSLFGIYETGHEYWINIDRIHIQPEFAASKIGYGKWKYKWNYFRKTGKLESKIILNKDFVLLDGYSSHQIAKQAELVKVPVWFVD